MLEKIKEVLQKIPWPFFVVGFVGVVLLIWGSLPEKKPAPVIEATLERPQIGEEEKLAQLLSSLGIGSVKVMITYEDEGKTHVAEDKSVETTYDGSGVRSVKESTEVVRMKTASGETGLVLVQESPKVSGVVVTTSKPLSTAQKLRIIEAIRALWDLPLGRIVVLGKE